MFIYNSWDFTITTGYNKILLDYPKAVNRARMIYLLHETGVVALDQQVTATYSDISWTSTIQRITPLNNTRFSLQPITNYTTYQTSISIDHKYQTPGIYNVSFAFFGSQQIFYSAVNITDCKPFKLNFKILVLNL